MADFRVGSLQSPDSIITQNVLINYINVKKIHTRDLHNRVVRPTDKWCRTEIYSNPKFIASTHLELCQLISRETESPAAKWRSWNQRVWILKQLVMIQFEKKKQKSNISAPRKELRRVLTRRGFLLTSSLLFRIALQLFNCLCSQEVFIIKAGARVRSQILFQSSVVIKGYGLAALLPTILQITSVVMPIRKMARK